MLYIHLRLKSVYCWAEWVFGCVYARGFLEMRWRWWRWWPNHAYGRGGANQNETNVCTREWYEERARNYSIFAVAFRMDDGNGIIFRIECQSNNNQIIHFVCANGESFACLKTNWTSHCIRSASIHAVAKWVRNEFHTTVILIYGDAGNIPFCHFCRLLVARCAM